MRMPAAMRWRPSHPLALRLLRALGYGLATLCVLLALAWWGVPHLVRHELQAQGAERLGRAVTAGRIIFRPWRLELSVQDLAVAGAQPDAAPQLTVSHLRVRIAPSSLLRLAPVINTLHIDSPYLRVAHTGEGRYDVDDILARVAATPRDPQDEPVRFALHDLQLGAGAADVDDRGQMHQVRDLTLSLPLLSSLESQREQAAQPRLAFTLDGSRFDSAAQATPFAEVRKGEATLRFQGLDLAPYLGYWPAGLPARLTAGVLDADLQFAFAQATGPEAATLDIRGRLTAHRLAAVDAQGAPLLQAEQLDLQLAHVRPLAQDVAIEQITLRGPRLQLRRLADGRLAVMPKPAAPAPAPAAGAAQAASAPWTVSLAQAQIHDGALDWSDAAAAGAGPLRLHEIEFTLKDLAWPLRKPVPVELRAQADGAAAPKARAAASAQLAAQGAVALDGGRIAAQLKGLPLAWAGPYLKPYLKPSLGGTLATELDLAWTPAGATLEARTLGLDKLALEEGGTLLAGLERLQLDGARVDTARRSVVLPRVIVTAPQADVARTAQGRWMFEDWLPPSTAEPAPLAARGAAAPAWSVDLAALEVAQGSVRFRDAGRPQPVAVDLSELKLSLARLAWPLAKGTAPSALEMSARVAEAAAEGAQQRGRRAAGRGGTLQLKGTAALLPLALEARVEARQLPLQAFDAYFGDLLNVQVARADVGFTGQVRYAEEARGPAWQVQGDALLEDTRILSAAPLAPASAPASEVRPAALARRGMLSAGAFSGNASSLLGWKTLDLRGVAAAASPGAPLRVEVRESTWSDFFARIAIDPSGRINLQDLVKQSASAPDSVAASPGGTRASGQNDAQNAAAAPIVRIGPTRFVNGQVLFSDQFVKPSYSANLSELQGRLGGFSSERPAAGAAPAMADLELRGKAEGTASLEISGQLNPLVKPLALDVKGKVRDLELPPLSPYSVKYAGHGIERGKMDVDVAYRIQPDGQLTAQNSLVLRQLVFGEQVDGAPTSLPVRLAAALLADRNGVIDLNLPISGSLNDPQFSLGPVIAKAVVNLIVRAVTSPFSLISSAFSGSGSGGEQASQVPFAPGSAELSDTAREDLGKIAKALADRPGLNMTVIGTVNREAEEDGLRRARLQQLLRQEKRRGQRQAPGQPAAAAPADAGVTPEEAPELLRRLYDRTDLPGKPRNLIGMAKSLPPQEMENLLLAQIDVSDAALQNLAVQRGTAVRDYLVQQGVPSDRLFVGAARRVAQAQGFSPHAELTLSTR